LDDVMIVTCFTYRCLSTRTFAKSSTRSFWRSSYRWVWSGTGSRMLDSLDESKKMHPSWRSLTIISYHCFEWV